MTSCIFCQIAAGNILSYLVYEDSQFLSFLDIMPVVDGHALVIPKKHYRWVHDVREFGPLWQVAQKVALAQIKVLKSPTVIFATAGFQVPHAHIHILPMPERAKGEFLPGVESAKRIKITSQQLQLIASKLRTSIK